MKLKHLYISTGILAILALATNFIKNSDTAHEADERVGKSIIEESLVRNVQQILLKSNNNSLTIKKDEANKKWLLQERYDMPVSMDKLSTQINSILNAELQRLVSSNPERIKSLGFDSGESIALTDGDGNEILNIELGKVTDQGRQIIRFAGEDKAFLANTAFSVDDNADAWLNKKLVEIEKDKIRSIEVALANGDRIDFQRESNDADWTAVSLPDGKEVDKSKVDNLLNKITGLSFTKTQLKDADEVVAAKANSHTFVATLENGNSYTYAIGRRPEVKVAKEVEVEGENGEKTIEEQEEVETPEGPVYVFVTSSSQSEPVNTYMKKSAFEIASYQFTSLPKALDDLLEDAPEPIEEPTGKEVSSNAPLPLPIPELVK